MGAQAGIHEKGALVIKGLGLGQIRVPPQGFSYLLGQKTDALGHKGVEQKGPGHSQQ